MDEKDSLILSMRRSQWNQIEGPRVGDFIEMKDGTMRRFTYHWGDGIQVTSTISHGRFYLGDGFASYSGGLDPSIPLDKIEPHPKLKSKLGEFWFFHHNTREAHNGVNVSIFCRVFKEKE